MAAGRLPRRGRLVAGLHYLHPDNDIISFHGELLDPTTLTNNSGAEFEERKFFVVYLPTNYDDQMEIWNEKGIVYNFEARTFDWTNLLLGFAPWLLLIA